MNVGVLAQRLRRRPGARTPRPARAAGVGAGVLVALVVAEGAVLLLRPRAGLIDPLPVRASSYFSPAELARAREFRRPQLLIGVGQLAVELGVLGALARRPWRPAGRLAGRPLLGAAAAGAGVSVALAVASLPLGAVATQRARDAGLVTQGWAGWAADLGKSTAIGAVLTAAAATGAVALMRRLPRAWWVPASGVAVVVGAGFLFAGPVLLDPLFNRFTPLPEGRTRSDVLALARDAGVHVGQVLEMDASRRTTAANAYVTGVANTKRVVLYDTLVRNFTREDTRLVVAHELGHVHYGDVPRGLLYLALAGPAATFGIARLTRRLAGAEPPGAATVPALLLSAAVVATGVTWVSNALSRRVEARADAYSLRLTHAPAPFISFERGIALRNLADPDPPWLAQVVLGTHPSTVQRIGMAEAYARTQVAR
jgi:STE24 endopeptidase